MAIFKDKSGFYSLGKQDLKEMSDWEDVWGKNVPGKGTARAEARAALAYQQEKWCGWSELGRGKVTAPEAPETDYFRPHHLL